MGHTVQIPAPGGGRGQAVPAPSAISPEAMRQMLERAAKSCGETPSAIIQDERQELKDVLPASLAGLEAGRPYFRLPHAGGPANTRNRAERRQRCRRKRH